MECSLSFNFCHPYGFHIRLNPCFNGMLSENLKESVLDFSCFFSLFFNPFCVRELVSPEYFFANVCGFIFYSK